jgi:hypothetical protein
VGHGGPCIRASYTYSKSLDDTSSVVGGFVTGSAGAAAVAFSENPLHTAAERSASTFDVKNAFAASIVQDLHWGRVPFMGGLPKKLRWREIA